MNDLLQAAAESAQTLNTLIRGGTSSTASWRSIPTTKALFMALLENRPMVTMDWCSLRTS